mgnify:CR=1 FL=1
MDTIDRLIKKRKELDRLDSIEDYGGKRLNYIRNDNFIAFYEETKNKEAIFRIINPKKNVDIESLYPENMKHLYLDLCEHDTLPRIPDTVELLVIEQGNIVKFDKKLPESIKELSIYGINAKKIPELKHLKNLWSLKIIYCNFLKKLPELPDSIKILEVDYCEKLEEITFPLPKKLVYGKLDSLHLKYIPNDFRYLTKLKRLNLLRSGKVENIKSKKDILVNEGVTVNFM